MRNNIRNRFYISVPADFNFLRTVYSHGWSSLKPFSVDKENQSLDRLLELNNNKLVYARISSSNSGKLRVAYQTKQTLNESEKKELIRQIKNCLRMGENFEEFYTIVKKDKEFSWVYDLKAGRLLRSPTVFEDIVKLICTTNCSWSLTEVIVNNLTTKLGKKFLIKDGDGINKELFSFPTPKAIANVDEKYLRSEIRAGYRAPYLLELAKRADSTELNLESWKNDQLSTDELFRMVTSIKGIGPYAAGNMLKLLGYYDHLAIDSWCRTKFFQRYKSGRKVSDKSIEKFYSSYGQWRGLFFWMDVTKDWYEHKFPF
jgi:3-methyladenine DNA glycosylase/8-oxoguanine DNA glycosylase